DRVVHAEPRQAGRDYQGGPGLRDHSAGYARSTNDGSGTDSARLATMTPRRYSGRCRVRPFRARRPKARQPAREHRGRSHAPGCPEQHSWHLAIQQSSSDRTSDTPLRPDRRSTGPVLDRGGRPLSLRGPVEVVRGLRQNISWRVSTESEFDRLEALGDVIAMKSEHLGGWVRKRLGYVFRQITGSLASLGQCPRTYRQVAQ